MDITKPAPFVFTVAGTNGKGTPPAARWKLILMAAGYKVGVYSSPHLVRYTERVRIQGLNCRRRRIRLRLLKSKRRGGDISLTYFEYGTLSALVAV